MHNLKEIRKNFDTFKKALKKRLIDFDLEKLEKLDKQNRECILKKETLEKEKKDISKSKDKSLFEKSKKISKEIEIIEKKQNDVKLKLEEILSNIPNIPNKDVPFGKDENDNIEVSKSGMPTDLHILKDKYSYSEDIWGNGEVRLLITK